MVSEMTTIHGTMDPTRETTSASDAGELHSPSTATTLSVVIPTYNRCHVLVQTLEALERQSLARDRFEVIVVDDGSSDGTADTVQSRSTSLDLNVVRGQNGGLAAARNRGIERARGDVIVFLDDDVMPHEDFLHEHRLEHLKDSNIVVLGSLPFHPDVVRSSFLWYLDQVTFFDLFKDPEKYAQGRPPMPPMNGNSSVRREHLAQYGSYDVSFRQYGGEDLELGYRLQNSGLRFVYNPQAIGYHYHTKGFEAFCRDQERAGYAVARLAEKHPEVRVAKRVDVVSDPWSRLSAKKKVLRLGLRGLLLFPLPVWIVRGTVGLLQGAYPLRRLLVPLFRLGSHYYYAKGIDTYRRRRPPG